MILQLFLSLLFGVLGGYLASTYTPVQSQIAVVDVQKTLRRAIDRGSARTEEDAKVLADKLKAATSGLADQGIVVIDANAVVNAPEEAYVDVKP